MPLLVVLPIRDNWNFSLFREQKFNIERIGKMCPFAKYFFVTRFKKYYINFIWNDIA